MYDIPGKIIAPLSTSVPQVFSQANQFALHANLLILHRSFHTIPEVITSTKGNNNVAVLYSVNLLNSVSRRLYKLSLFHVVADGIVHYHLTMTDNKTPDNSSSSGQPFRFPTTVQDRYVPVTLRPGTHYPHVT
jgi:hypothetical protein